jgi:hypothetical protein
MRCEHAPKIVSAGFDMQARRVSSLLRGGHFLALLGYKMQATLRVQQVQLSVERIAFS